MGGEREGGAIRKAIQQENPCTPIYMENALEKTNLWHFAGIRHSQHGHRADSLFRGYLTCS